MPILWNVKISEFIYSAIIFVENNLPSLTVTRNLQNRKFQNRSCDPLRIHEHIKSHLLNSSERMWLPSWNTVKDIYFTTICEEYKIRGNTMKISEHVTYIPKIHHEFLQLFCMLF